MFLLRIALLLLPFVTSAAEAPGQGTTIAERLQHLFARSGEDQLAIQKLSGKQYAALDAMLQQKAVLNPLDQAEIAALQGSVAFLAGKMNDAVMHFGKAAGLGTLRDPDTFTLAMALVSLGENRRAESVLSDLSTKHPEQALYVYWLGRLDYDWRLYSKAEKEFQAAVELDPESTRAWDSLGLTYDMQGQMERARDAFSKAVDLNRRSRRPSPWPPHDQGYLYLRMNQLQAAESALDESLRYDEKLAAAHYHLARALEKEGRTAEAITQYLAAITDDKAASDACYSLAMLYRKLHREGEAATMFAEYKQRKASTPGQSPQLPNSNSLP